MKIQKYNAGALTNFEVIEFLRKRGASQDPSRVMAPIAPSEFKVFDHLFETTACNQTREIVDEFIEKCEPYNLAKAEIFNIINIRPSTPAQIYPIIEKADERLGEEKLEDLVNMVLEVLPAPPSESNSDEVAAEEANADEETATEEQMEEGAAEEVNADEGTATEDQMEVS